MSHFFAIFNVSFNWEQGILDQLKLVQQLFSVAVGTHRTFGNSITQKHCDIIMSP